MIIMITFQINDRTIEVEPTMKLYDVKQLFIQRCELDCRYVDIEVHLERPIRSLGKFNLESGIMPRTFDNYTLDRWELDNRTITVTLTPTNDYEHRPLVKRQKTAGIYRPTVSDISSGDSYVQPHFDLSSSQDFPSLS